MVLVLVLLLIAVVVMVLVATTSTMAATIGSCSCYHMLPFGLPLVIATRGVGQLFRYIEIG